MPQQQCVRQLAYITEDDRFLCPECFGEDPNAVESEQDWPNHAPPLCQGCGQAFSTIALREDIRETLDDIEKAFCKFHNALRIALQRLESPK